RYLQCRIPHLQEIAHNLLERIAVVGKNAISQFLFDLFSEFIEAHVGGICSLSARLQMQLNFSRPGQNGRIYVRIFLVDWRNSASHADSPSPVIFSTRVAITCFGTFVRNLSSTPPSNSAFNSWGGPGSSMISLSFPSDMPLIHCPGAVPFELCNTVAPAITSACFTLFGDIFQPCSANLRSMACKSSGSRRSLRPSVSATASRVRSSSVGPSPPLKITMSARERAVVLTRTISFKLSPTMLLNATSTPRLFNFSVR